MGDVADQKAAARKAAFQRRRDAQGEGAAKAAAQRLIKVLAPFGGWPIAGYMPIRTEIDPLPVMTAMADSGEVGVPVVTGAGQPLVFHRWTPGAAMVPGDFGALIPQEPRLMVPRIVILPLLAFDQAGMRLGYGGGFYDRTLQGLRRQGEVIAIGFAYTAQGVSKLPVEPTDQPMDMLVTEAGVTRFT